MRYAKARRRGNTYDQLVRLILTDKVQFINKTFATATPSISINGMDSSSSSLFQSPTAFNTTETVEYEPFDTQLAARVTSLYAQLESLTTTVAQLRRDAPARAVKEYGDQLKKALLEDDDDNNADEAHAEAERAKESETWNLRVPLGAGEEAQRWRNGDVAQAYEDALRTLLHLQGEEDTSTADAPDTDGGDALATTVGKAERAMKAAEVLDDRR